MTWDPAQYERFKAERSRPFHDLLDRVPDGPYQTIADLGCGTGELTGLLRQRWPAARVWGVDNSTAMLEKARGSATLRDIEFVEADLLEWSAPEPLDLILSNAAIHWIPDQSRLLERLAAQLSPGGVLAVQAPNNREAPAYRILETLIAEAPWKARLADAPPQPGIETPDWYIAKLHALGFAVSLWETIYHHRMPDAAEIVEWMKGTTLTPILATLPEAQAGEFLEEMTGRVSDTFRPGSAGVIFPFRRLFFVALDATADPRAV